MSNELLSAVLLAAGHSTRMGRDKALLEVDGVPLWRRQGDVLRRAGATEMFLSARPDQPWVASTSGFDAVLHDALPGCGPIAGITAALERMTHPHLAVLAIDLPAIGPAWFSALSGQISPGVGVVGRHGGFFEPLAAVYPRALKWLAWETIARGEYSLQVLLRAAAEKGLMRIHDLGPDEVPWFLNWNEAAGQ